MKIKLDWIQIHPDLQARVTMNEEMIGTLIPIYEKVKRGEHVWTQNIVIFRDTTTKDYYLLDGHHRLEAMKRAGLTETSAEVPRNIHTIEDALLRSLSVNSTHGENFRPADIRRAVELLLKYQPEMTVERICFHLHRGKSVIYQYVRELSSSGKLNLPETRVGKDGKKRPTKYTNRQGIPELEETLKKYQCPKCGEVPVVVTVDPKKIPGGRYICVQCPNEKCYYRTAQLRASPQEALDAWLRETESDREETALLQKKKPVLLKRANVQHSKAETKVKRCPHCGGILD